MLTLRFKSDVHYAQFVKKNFVVRFWVRNSVRTSHLTSMTFRPCGTTPDYNTIGTFTLKVATPQKRGDNAVQNESVWREIERAVATVCLYTHVRLVILYTPPARLF